MWKIPTSILFVDCSYLYKAAIHKMKSLDVIRNDAEFCCFPWLTWMSYLVVFLLTASAEHDQELWLGDRTERWTEDWRGSPRRPDRKEGRICSDAGTKPTLMNLRTVRHSLMGQRQREAAERRDLDEWDVRSIFEEIRCFLILETAVCDSQSISESCRRRLVLKSFTFLDGDCISYKSNLAHCPVFQCMLY